MRGIVLLRSSYQKRYFVGIHSVIMCGKAGIWPLVWCSMLLILPFTSVASWVSVAACKQVADAVTSRLSIGAKLLGGWRSLMFPELSKIFSLNLSIAKIAIPMRISNFYQLEIITMNVISGIIYFREFILESSRNFSETPPGIVPVGQWAINSSSSWESSENKP